MNSAWVNTFDFLGPTGRPLAETTPSTGFRRFRGCDEKNSEPNANGDTLLARGDVRGVGRSAADAPRPEETGWARTNSYISRNFEKSVGKKISKYP